MPEGALTSGGMVGPEMYACFYDKQLGCPFQKIGAGSKYSTDAQESRFVGGFR
jgi:hypothetical protein